MELNSNTKILIVGLGVMGGSYAKALTKKGYKIKAIDISQKTIDYALENKLISYGTTDVEPSLVSEADIIVFALYPHTFKKWITDYQKYFRPGIIITDVTGVKGCIVYDIQSILREDVEFIAAHPMAGRERSGIEYSDDKVFIGANYIVTPTAKNTRQAIELCKTLGSELGFKKISEITPELHDEMIAFLSQLTHCIAVALMTAGENPSLRDYSGDSFRDLTRIAKINDEMWSELFLLNRDALLREMDSFEREFKKMRACVEKGDRETMREMMRCSTERRALFDK